MDGMTWVMIGSGIGSAALIGLWLWWLGRVDAQIAAERQAPMATQPPISTPVSPMPKPTPHALLRAQQQASIAARPRTPRPATERPMQFVISTAPTLPTLTLPQLATAITPYPGIAILGPSRQGKTTLAEALLRLIDGEIAIIDPKWRLLDPPKWGNLPAARIVEGEGYSPIASTLAALWAAYEARIARGHSEVNATYDPLWVIWDEINDTVAALKESGVYLRRWAQMGAEHGIRLILMPQSDRVASLGLVGHGDARRNIVWCYIGDDARTKARELVATNRMNAEQAENLCADRWPALAHANGRWIIVDRSAAPELAAMPIAPTRAWQPPQPETAETPDETVSATPETSVSALPEPIETVSNSGVSGFKSNDFLPVARLVAANLISETNALKHGFGVKPGGSKEYTAAREALKQALEIVRAEDV